MKTRTKSDLPAKLARGRERFEKWRGKQKTRTRLPEHLWSAAVKLAQEYGIMAMSNIRSYSRTQLLIEMLIRLHRVLSDEDKARFKELLDPFVNQPSGQYIYRLERGSIPHEQEKLAQLYHRLYEALCPDSR